MQVNNVNKTESDMLDVKVRMDPSYLEKGNIEDRKYCCDWSTSNNGRGRHDIEIRGQRDITGWWADRTGVETDMEKGETAL